jgi:hypothetical protein
LKSINKSKEFTVFELCIAHFSILSTRVLARLMNFMQVIRAGMLEQGWRRCKGLRRILLYYSSSTGLWILKGADFAEW